MRQALSFTLALVLFTGLAWAEEPAAEIIDPALEGGNCMLPDLAGLSDEEIAAAALSAGLGVEPAQASTPSCPVKFDCTSITNCGPGACTVTDIGSCCTPSSGLKLCCTSGTIKVRRCPCTCTGNPCSFTCVNSTGVDWRCQ